MVKSVKGVFVVLVISSLISLSFDRKMSMPNELVVGEKAPEAVLCNGKQPLNLSPSKHDGYTLLSFWASYDAASRAMNTSLRHIAENDARIRMVSVSFDHYESVYRASMMQDGNQDCNSYRETDGENSEIYKSYGLKNGFTNYLIDNKGVIVAINITPDRLSDFLD